MSRIDRNVALVSLWLALVFAVSSTLHGQERPAAPPAEELSEDEQRERGIVERFVTVLERNPRRGTALDKVYGYHVERGTLDELVARYETRTKQNDADGAAWLILGLVESQRGRDAAAVAALKKAEEHLPESAMASYYLGQSLVLVGQPDAAAAAFERAIDRKPAQADLLDLFQALGRVYQRALKHDQALEVWNRLERLFPEDQRVQEQIAAALLEEGQHAAALPRFESLAKKTKDRYRQTQFQIQAAEIRVRLGQSEQALKDLETLLGDLNPDNWLFRDVRRRIEEVFLRNEDQAGLAKYYERWIETHKDDVDAMARLSRVLASQNRLPEAQSWLEKALKLAPSRKELRLAFIEQLVFDGRIAAAVGQYEALDKTDPNNPDYVREWGKLILRDKSRPEADRKKQAAAVWKRLTDAKPDDPVIATQVADQLRHAEIADEALALYRKAVKLSPESAQYREYLGEYLHTLKRSDEALAVWKDMAAGKNRTSKNLGRLAEVLAGFGYQDEAIANMRQAIELEDDDFNLRLKAADLFILAEQHDNALRQLDAADPLAASDEEREAALDRRIRTYQSLDTLEKQTEALLAELKAGKQPTALRWYVAARYQEVLRQYPEATQSLAAAQKADAKFIPALVATARVQESSGNLQAAADTHRRLAAADRRYRTEYLTNVAKLEARLGRRAEALQAGRDVIASAPGNPEHYEFFSGLCFQLGETDEGLDALRRSVRANPADPKVVLTLAAALSEQFRTGEAIELYWQAFEKTTELEDKLGVIGSLAQLYLQTNQFDRLLDRLERERREPGQQRVFTICLAQAHHAAGDHGSARAELESLLTQDPRDTQLLQQLSTLSESDGDLPAAIKYQQQLNQIAPDRQGESRLAQLLMRSGDTDEATNLLVRLTVDQDDPEQLYRSLDSLLAGDRPDAAILALERLRREQPNSWELLYREGAALAADKPAEAAERFRAILALRLPDDEQSAVVKHRQQKRGARPTTGTTTVSRASVRAQPQSHPLVERQQSAYRARYAAGLQNEDYYGGGSTRQFWAPEEFGQTRIAALAWLLRLSRDAKQEEAFEKSVREPALKENADDRALWDWYYLQIAEQDQKGVYEAARELSKTGDPAGQWLYLSSLPNRFAGENQVVYESSQGEDTRPPLPADELDDVLACYRSMQQKRPEFLTAYGYYSQQMLSNVALELKRAGRQEEQDRLIENAIAAADDPAAIVSALQLITDRVGQSERIFELLDKLEASVASAPQASGPYNYYGGPENALGPVMSALADDKQHAEVLRLFDRYLDYSLARKEAEARRRPAARRSSRSAANRYSFPVWVGKNTQHRQLDYPNANEYFERGSIQLLRNAFELYQRDDLLSDFTGFLEQNAATAPAGERIHWQLGLAYVSWWNEDRDAALRHVEQACALAPADVGLKLELAELHERQNQFEEALAIADEIVPLDHVTLQDREVLALRVSVQSGNVERARQAAERLFGLRLDADLQLQLATQMRQLGMHEMAEAVLGRVQRQAGNRMAALTGLMVQYQSQSKPDVAAQIAYQILRRSQPKPIAAGGRNVYREEDGARQQALQVLGRIGKLDELIARAEEQRQKSPNSAAIRQTLVEYYQAAGKQDKVAEIHRQMLEQKPDDAGLRYTIAQQLTQAGKAAEAVEHFKVAIVKDPSLLMRDYYQVQNAFQQANKLEELALTLEQVDFKSFSSNYYYPMNLVQNLMENEKTRDAGLRLFRKTWDAFPSQRSNLFGYVYRDDLWKLPEIYDYARKAIIPQDAASLADPWQGIGNSNGVSFSGDGTVTGMMTRVLRAAEEQGKLDALAAEVEQALEKIPAWTGGKMLRAAIRLKQRKPDEARVVAEELLKDEKARIPTYAVWQFAQELEKFGATEAVALKLYEQSLASPDPQNSSLTRQYQYSPAKRLVALYRKAGRKDDARAIMLKAAAAPSDDQYDRDYSAYRRVETLSAIGKELTDLGYPLDAVRLYNGLLADRDTLQTAERWSGNSDRYTQQINQGFTAALAALDKHAGHDGLADLLKPAGESESGPDLVLIVHPAQMNQAQLKSVVCTVLETAAAKPDARDPALTAVDAALADAPDSIPLHVAAVLARSAGQKPDSLPPLLVELERLLERHPLEELPADVRANARQRDEAAPQAALWLVARKCLRRQPLKERGEALAGRALEAARRQLDPQFALAILREWGQIELNQGNREAAEARWSEMLDLVLQDPNKKKSPPKPDKARTAAAVKTSAVNSPRRAGGVSPLILGGVARASERIRGLTPPARLMLALQLAPAAPPRPAPAAASASVPPVSLTRFNQAAEIAQLAARHGMHELSARAVRESLAGGPPLRTESTAQFGRANSSGRIIRSTDGQPAEDAAITQSVEDKLSRLTETWRQQGAPPELVYETLAAAVFPAGRPVELFLYARSIGAGNIQQPRSVGRLLAQAASDAGQADDLRQRAESRLSNPASELPCRVLLVQLGLAADDVELAKANLDALAARADKNPTRYEADLASHAALPALSERDLGNSAVAVLDVAAKQFSDPNQGDEPAKSLLLLVGRHRLRAGDERGKDQLEESLRVVEAYGARHSGDYGLYMRRNHLHRLAGEYAALGRLSEALDKLGQFIDSPNTRYGEPNLATTLRSIERLLSSYPVAERYALLKAWSLPAAGRNLVRSLATLTPADDVPDAFRAQIADEQSNSMSQTSEPGASATLLWLIAAAHGADKLDELARELAPLAQGKVENAEIAALLTDLVRGGGEASRARLEQRAKSLEDNLPSQGQGDRPVPLADYLVARACLADPQLAPLGERMLRTLLTHSQRVQNHGFLSRARYDLAAAVAHKHTADLQPGSEPGLALWHPGSHQSANMHSSGSTPVWWLAHEGHVTHLGGPERQFLYFDYPLAGTFEFTVDAWMGGWAEGNVSYGGLLVEMLHGGDRTVVSPVGHHERLRRPDPLERRDDFNTLTVRVEPGKVSYLCNGRLVYEDDQIAPSSPWLALESNRGSHSWFRNPRLTGSPEIPREVRLTHEDRLDGWITSFYGESQPPQRTAGRPQEYDAAQTVIRNASLDAYDWAAKDGLIHGRKIDSAGLAAARPSRLCYNRPLRDGETLAYEFLYEPDATLVHPALDRLVFLLGADGLRLHWMLDNPEGDPSGLAADHSIEAGDTGGPLPLKAGEWNAVEVSLRDGAVHLKLNGEEIHSRPLDESNDRLFSLFHFKDRTAAQVRNVVLTGDWPETLPAAALAELFEQDTRRDSPLVHRARHAVVTEEVLLRNAEPVLDQARTLSAADRFEFLRDWVMPNSHHATFRLLGRWTADESARAKGRFLESPAIELVAVAAELDKLEDLKASADRFAADNNTQARGAAAFSLLVALAREDEAEAAQILKALDGLVQQADQNDAEPLRWPELTAGLEALRVPALRKPAAAVLQRSVQRLARHNIGGPWDMKIRFADALARFTVDTGRDPAEYAAQPPLEHWFPIAQPNAQLRGIAAPGAHWQIANGEAKHFPSATHADDVLYFNTPLRGNFEISCELTSFGWREIQPMYAGHWFGAFHTRKQYEHGRIGRSTEFPALPPPELKIDQWYHYRQVVADGRTTIFLNGRQIHEETLPADHDPWLAVRCRGINAGGIRNLAVTGTPVVPEQILLSAGSELLGWRSDFYGETIAAEAANWRKAGEEIVGKKLEDPPPAPRESLLQYHRPLAEDGTLEFEFFYVPDQAEVAPALDRLAFLLRPEGVKLHHLTCGQHDRTGLAVDNLEEVAESRRGPGQLPLKPNEWNRVTLALEDDTLRLALNGEEVYEHELEAGNSRQFGLFHFSDQTESRVREILHRGQWPRALPKHDAENPLLQ